MIVVQAPLRITLGGGGSDLDPHKGLCIAAAIDKYVTIVANHTIDDDYVLRYSSLERVGSVLDVQHAILRACLQATNTGPGIEIAATADLPAGTGLGSSGAFTVAVLRALLPDAPKPTIARMACDIDTGQQDQHAAVYGGVNLYDFRAKTIRPIETTIDRYLGLYYTGRRREAGQEPAGVPDRRSVDRELQAIEHNDPDRLGWCLNNHWRAKLERHPSADHYWCDAHIQAGIVAGAHGGKLLGAGGGGFLLFAADDLEPVTDVMKRRGLVHVPFRFDHQGVR